MPVPNFSFFDMPTNQFKHTIYKDITEPSEWSSNYIAKITSPSLGSVIGLLNNNLSMSTRAAWEASGLLETITSSNTLVSQFYEVAKVAVGLSGYANPSNLGLSSKKFYQGNCYIDISLDFRIVDWYDEGAVSKAVYVLLSSCVPKFKGNLSNAIDGAPKEFADALTTISNVITTTKKGAEEIVTEVANKLDQVAANDKSKEGIVRGLVGTFSSVIKGSVGGLEIASKAIGQILDPTILTLATSPEPVAISVGGYFDRGDMVIESCDATFSKEMMKSGPLYADIKIRATSREAIMLDGTTNSAMGLCSSSSLKRTELI